jgi:YegS/Rv2252/BmrU family lipid kinase
MDKVHVIVNPFSARGKTEARWSDIKEVIRFYFREFKYIFTEKPKHATEIARELLQEGFDLIIGVGGDGTLNEITNGFFKKDSREAVNMDASLSIIPSGTGSDFVRSFKIPGDFKRSIEMIKNAGRRKFDVGRVTFRSPGGQDTGKYFINVSDFGLGAEVVRHLSAIPSGKRSALSYYTGLLSTIKTYKSKTVRIVIDDKEEITGRYLIGAIANGRIFGGGMKIAPGAEPDDGYFDLVLVDDMKKFEIVRNSRHLYTGKLHKHPKVTIKKARNIKVFSESGEPVNIEYDGEAGQATPAEYQILEKSINLRI